MPRKFGNNCCPQYISALSFVRKIWLGENRMYNYPGQEENGSAQGWLIQQLSRSKDERAKASISEHRSDYKLDTFLLSIKKRVLLPVVILAAFFLWLSLCHEHYKSYWLGTIYRVQTTDFNILHHILPPVLSQMIIASRDDLIQRTLDSNYGSFDLIITDPSDKSVIYRTGGVEHPIPEDLARIKLKEPYDLLTDPPPLEPGWEHRSARADQAVRPRAFKSRNQAAILGHLYYVRPDPPAFFDDLANFFSGNLFENSGAKRGYLYITFITMALGNLSFFAVWLRQSGVQIKQNELEHLERELELRKKALEQLAQELVEHESRKILLEKEADDFNLRAVRLRQALIELRGTLSLADVERVSGPAADVFSESGSQLQAKDRQTGARPVKGLQTDDSLASGLLDEVERLIPALSENAQALKTQASLLNDYCHSLEQRQAEMKKIVEQATFRTNRPSKIGLNDLPIDMTP